MAAVSRSTEAEGLVHAVSHGLANRLLAIRCHAELAAADLRRGDDPASELELLVAATDDLSTLARELAQAALAAAAQGLDPLSDAVSRLFPQEAALLHQVSRS